MGEASQARHEMDAPILSCSLPRIVPSAAEPSERTAYIKLNRQTPCPPRGAVPVNQGCRLSFFTHDLRFGFGHGGDHSSYPWYLKSRRQWPEWLVTDRVLGNLGYGPEDRHGYAAYLEGGVLEWGIRTLKRRLLVDAGNQSQNATAP